MNTYDVVVIGGGPAGGQCARTLSQLGRSVLLVERYRTFQENNFSTAGTTLDAVARFGLPDHVIGSSWRRIALLSTRREQVWESPEPAGAVLEFGALREFLAEETRRFSGEVRMHCRYEAHVTEGKGIEVHLRALDSQSLEKVRCQFLVDATGPARRVLRPRFDREAEYASGTAVEYLVEVEPERYLPDTLYFFMGKKWSPRGYSWIFPMGKNRLKVGVGHIRFRGNRVQGPLLPGITKLLEEFVGTRQYKILDKHGGVCRYSLGQRDTFVEGRVCAVGDAVSSINLLGGEGIRHGMHSGELAARQIEVALAGGEPDLAPYERQIREYFGTRWLVCERLARLAYGNIPDFFLDALVPVLGSRYPLMEDLKRKLFDYEFSSLAQKHVSWRFFSQLFMSRLRYNRR